MADNLKELFQVNPGAASLTDGYVVPGATSAMVIVTVTNRSATPTAFRLSLAIAGAADDPKQYKAYDSLIGGNVVIEMGPYAMAATDKWRVYATLATLTFTFNGIEVT